MASRVARYFRRNGDGSPWYERLRSIRVEDGVITVGVEVDLATPGQVPGHGVGRDICAAILGSDEADFAPGHRVNGSDDSHRTCETRPHEGGVPADAQGHAQPPPRPVVTHWLGEQFEGLAVSHRTSRSVIYGDCEPGADTGCAPPLEVQSWSICRRHPLEIDVIPTSMRRVRGVPVISYGDGVEVLTGTTTAVVFANERRMLSPAIDALRPTNEPRTSSADLPAPRLPRWALRELKLIKSLRTRGHSLDAMRTRLGISKSAIAARLRLADVLGAKALRGVGPARFTPRQVIEDRQAWMAGQEGFLDRTDRQMVRRARRHAARVNAC